MKKYISVAFLLAWIGLILFLSFQNGTDTAGTSMTFTSDVLRFFIHREPEYELLMLWDARFRLWAHFVLLFFYGMICFEVVYQWTGKMFSSLIASAFTGSVLGAVAEIGKLWIDGRHCQMDEMMLNIVGALVGVVVIVRIHYIYRRLRRSFAKKKEQ